MPCSNLEILKSETEIPRTQNLRPPFIKCLPTCALPTGCKHYMLHPLVTNAATVSTGAEQEALARAAGFMEAVHYELAGGLMGCLVATKPTE